MNLYKKLGIFLYLLSLHMVCFASEARTRVVTIQEQQNALPELGLEQTAHAADIKNAYHRLSRQYHPDHNNDAESKEKMQCINCARAILRDANYEGMMRDVVVVDSVGEERSQDKSQGQFSHEGPESIFNDFMRN